MTFKFLFFFGWLNVAQTLYNPFGCDDEDFELTDLINRHIKVAATIVDEGNDFPEVRDDVFWNSPKGIDEEKEFVSNHEEGMLMENKIKSIAEIVVDERQGGNWKKSSFASRSESRDMGH